MAAASEQQWGEFWRRLAAKGDASSLWQSLRAAYTESWRAYHNLDHIGHCLAEFDTIRRLAHNPNAIEAAIWFHDAIYDTHAKDNEERSAELAVACLHNMGQPHELCESVRALILATKHNAPPDSKDAGLLTDIDLSILGQDEERYAEFERQIRSEYAWVPEAEFAAGRSAVLKGFLQRQSIYSTSPFVDRYEKQARANLVWAIKQLTR